MSSLEADRVYIFTNRPGQEIGVYRLNGGRQVKLPSPLGSLAERVKDAVSSTLGLDAVELPYPSNFPADNRS